MTQDDAIRPAPALAEPPVRSELPTQGKHVPALDGLRGFAILLVLWIHLFWIGPGDIGTGPARLFARLSTCGWMGVDLFFVLSGFLITGILCDTVGRERYFRNFYARRALRVFPLYYGFLALIVLLGLLHGDRWYSRTWLYAAYLQNVWYSPAAFSSATWMKWNHFWSLAVEEQFYLFWPFLIYLLRTRRRILVMALLLAAASAGARLAAQFSPVLTADQFFIYTWSPARFEGLLLGSALAAAVRTRLRRPMISLAPFVLSAGLAVLAWHGYVHGNVFFAGDRWMLTAGITVLGVTCCALVGTVLRTGGPATRVFEQPVLRFFGRYSYGLYVLHYTLHHLLELWLLPVFARYMHSKVLQVFAVGILALPLSVAAAYLSYEYFESRFLRLKSHFVA